MPLNDLSYFCPWKYVLHMLLQYNILYFFHCTEVTLNLYEKPREINDSIKQVKSTESKFTNDIIVSSLFWCRYSLFFFSFFCFLSFCFDFLKLKIYVLIHIRLCGRVSDKKVSPDWFPETRLLFFGLTIFN